MLGVDRLDKKNGLLFLSSQICEVVAKVFFWLLEATVNNSYTIYKEAMIKKGICCVTHKTFRKIILNNLAEPMRTSCSSTRTRNPLNLERLRPEKHTLAKGNKRRDCVVCSRRSGGGRHLTVFYCDSCRDKPSMCPAGCFTKYHTQRKYK